jgi:ATP-dependent DNA ligase
MKPERRVRCNMSVQGRPLIGPDWVHEIKHDGFRVMARRDGVSVRLLTRK